MALEREGDCFRAKDVLWDRATGENGGVDSLRKRKGKKEKRKKKKNEAFATVLDVQPPVLAGAARPL